VRNIDREANQISAKPKAARVPEAQDDNRHPPAEPETVSRPQRLLWQIGGFEPELLSAPECRTIRAKYSTIGVLVLATAVLSSCSAGYALDTVFHNGYLTLALSLLWGATVLSLDRFLVSSTRKNAMPRTVVAKASTLDCANPVAVLMRTSSDRHRHRSCRVEADRVPYHAAVDPGVRTR